MKHIDRMVTMYIHDECDKLHFLSKKLSPDLKAIAIDGSSPNIIKVIDPDVYCYYSQPYLRLDGQIRPPRCHVFG